MKISSCKAKGRKAAAKIAQLILSGFPSLMEEDVRVTPSSVPGPDLWLSPTAKNLFPFDVEVKKQEAISIWAALEQAASHGPNPVLFFTRNRSKMFAVIEAKKFVQLVKESRHL